MCNRIKGIMISEDFRPGYTSLVRISCKQWECPQCGPQNALQWRAYMLDRFNKAFGHEKWCFITITASGAAHRQGAEKTLRDLQKGWKRLYDRMRRHYDKKIEYIRVFEKHKSGRYHMHALVNVGAEYDKHEFIAENLRREFRHPENIWLKKACVALGLGWRCHIKRVWDDVKKTENVGLVVGYILKYMGKDMAFTGFPKHQRRVQTSRAIGSPQTAKTGRGTWTHLRELPITALAGYKKLIDISTGEILTPMSFEGEHYYPPLRYYNGKADRDAL